VPTITPLNEAYQSARALWVSLLIARSARRPVRLPKTGGDAFLEPYAGEGLASAAATTS
jgi:hypothetical protein